MKFQNFYQKSILNLKTDNFLQISILKAEYGLAVLVVMILKGLVHMNSQRNLKCVDTYCLVNKCAESL